MSEVLERQAEEICQLLDNGYTWDEAYEIVVDDFINTSEEFYEE